MFWQSILFAILIRFDQMLACFFCFLAKMGRYFLFLSAFLFALILEAAMPSSTFSHFSWSFSLDWSDIFVG
jgi:hypothetical protein